MTARQGIAMPPALLRHAALIHRRASRLDPVLRALMWSILSGVLFMALNTLMRLLSVQVSPYQTQFLRYLFGLAVVLPLFLGRPLRDYRPRSIAGQFLRGAVHTGALAMWFTAIPFVSVADATAIGFTGPIFIMLGAALVFGEKMRWERWLAAAIGFVGVLIVVAPKVSGAGGGYTLLMLGSAPLFAASVLFTKGLTRYEGIAMIVLWQAIAVTLLSAPMAYTHWHAPSAWQWVGFAACGVLGSVGHFCLTRSFGLADISATQSVKFLDLVWASILGWMVFDDSPSRSTLVGGAVICASTLWIARREARTVR
jgi:drug/metabolite transporter (DMT)-like permease